MNSKVQTLQLRQATVPCITSLKLK